MVAEVGLQRHRISGFGRRRARLLRPSHTQRCTRTGLLGRPRRRTIPGQLTFNERVEQFVEAVSDLSVAVGCDVLISDITDDVPPDKRLLCPQVRVSWHNQLDQALTSIRLGLIEPLALAVSRP